MPPRKRSTKTTRRVSARQISLLDPALVLVENGVDPKTVVEMLLAAAASVAMTIGDCTNGKACCHTCFMLQAETVYQKFVVLDAKQTSEEGERAN